MQKRFLFACFALMLEIGFDWSHHRPLPTTTDRYGREPNNQHGH